MSAKIFPSDLWISESPRDSDKSCVSISSRNDEVDGRGAGSGSAASIEGTEDERRFVGFEKYFNIPDIMVFCTFSRKTWNIMMTFI